MPNNKREKKDIESKPIIKEDLVTNSQNITKEEVVSKRPIDKTKILSNLSQLDLSVESQNKNLVERRADIESSPEKQEKDDLISNRRLLLIDA